MEKTPRVITEAARNQFDSSFKMLRALVDVTGEDMWSEYYNEVPYWYLVYHVAYFIDYWLHPACDESEFRSMKFDERIPPEFECPVGSELFISRTEMMEYLDKIQSKTSGFFDSLDDAQMALPAIEGQIQFTYTDVITAQIRHIMYNIGYLNAILRSSGAEESDWYAYNEHDC